MIVLLTLLVMVLFGLGFLNGIWWVAAAVVVFAGFRYGRDGWGRGDDSGFRNYRDYRDRVDRWDRRYSRQRRGRWNRQDREDRRDRERHW
ncbi:hypothetical protein [Streptomyces sp. TLI_146]|uniref:hypothetical protein n=1 Tax=Streptomyces sp. TLI_146 TaxID=1938858 RepID=UPI000C70279C|nr:hypothetical protein [Streptomyces sp. TLI_146]PKV83454.1 hypothetical protein BX283_0958 [Streptomyces sp. TLI_146]